MRSRVAVHPTGEGLGGEIRTTRPQGKFLCSFRQTLIRSFAYTQKRMSCHCAALSRRGSPGHIRDLVRSPAGGAGHKPLRSRPPARPNPGCFDPEIHITKGIASAVPFGLSGALRSDLETGHGVHSDLRAVAGSRRAARRAGKAQAARVTVTAKAAMAARSPSSTRKGTESMK